MIGKCPNCNIRLDHAPFNKREINEMILILNYRKVVESGTVLRPIEELGYCELCLASVQDIQEQKKLLLSGQLVKPN